MTKSLPSVLKFGERTANNDLEKANLLNECFASNFSEPSIIDVPLPNCSDFSLDNFNRLTVSVTQVASLLSTLDNSKACGSDNLSARILCECAEALAPPLTVIFNQCLLSGIYPRRWKEATVIPVHKKGSRSQADNYRSVSLLPIVSKPPINQ